MRDIEVISSSEASERTPMGSLDEEDEAEPSVELGDVTVKGISPKAAFQLGSQINN